jgi:hypothetical protein
MAVTVVLAVLWADSLTVQADEVLLRGSLNPLLPDPTVFLIRDARVRAELNLNEDQVASVNKLIKETNAPLWVLRDFPQEYYPQRWVEVTTLAERQLRKILDTEQRDRLHQLLLQAQGPSALIYRKVAEQVGVNEDQRQWIRAVVTATGRRLERIKAAGGKSRQEYELAAQEARGSECDEILSRLTAAQIRAWRAVQGPSFDLASLRPEPIGAPELKEGDAWINSEPLTLGSLRGQVVALHFWTFG